MTPILEAEALLEARRLAELMPGEDDLAVHRLLGWFHWFRHRALAVRTDRAPGRDPYEDPYEDPYADPCEDPYEERGRPDLRIAVQALTACFLAGEENLPEPLVPVLAENAAGYALQLLSDPQESDDPDRLSALADLWRRIVAAVPAGHPHRAVHLTALGNVLRIKWRRGGPPADLDTAIDRFREALAAVAEEPGRAMYLYNLGDALSARFDRAGAVEDLEDAVALLGEALRTPPDEGLYRALVLTGLGGALRTRYERTGALPDLDGAIARYREAVPLFPRDQPGLTEVLSHLGNVLRLRFERTGDTGDLDAAVEAGRRAVEATPEGHPGRAVFLSDLGYALQVRFGRLGVLGDLDASIVHHRQASEAVPADHPLRARYLSGLADALVVRFDHGGDPADRDEAVGAWSAAASTVPSPVLDRIGAGLSAALLLARSGEAERAAQAAEEAVRLMPRMAGRRLERQDRQDAIGGVAGLAGTAAALALAAPGGTARARAERALGLLEVGRAVMFGQALDHRGDLTDLHERRPELAARFAELRDRLDPPADAPVGDRHRTAEEFTAVLDEIRALEGFASFALPPPVEELRAEASHGPIVVFNVSRFRSDALLLTAEGLTGLPLPGLDHTTLVDRINVFEKALHTASSGTDPVAREGAQTVLADVLEWLWDAAAGPVLEALGHKGPPPPGTQGELPRVWWAPGGLLGLLPLHAAGHHTDAPDDPNRRTVMDRAVSSYTPTVRALRHARERGRALGAGGAAAAGRALIVAMPTTPGLPGEGRLRFVDAEADMLETRFPDRVLLREQGRDRDPAEEDTAPTKANVLAHLPHCAIAHFACHGTSDPADPSQSGLLLHDHAHAPLTVRSLAPVALDHARLAYLSACRTAAIDTVNLPDAVVHLTSAFQLAGFPHAIGTLWEIDDRIAVRIARAFYDGLRTDSGAVDPDRSARALHAAVRQVRDGHDLPPGHDRGRAPLLWAAHLHTGA
ncbi:CHAT domain-containing protein [Streptomyces sp. NPDC085665]|uniref:CHAT domain-containing protein n=1 Tax=Streptomyces sp. NPDC085665 TaxID=3365735 RepID=UPI0037D1C9A5